MPMKIPLFPILMFALAASIPQAVAQKKIVIRQGDMKPKEVSIDSLFEATKLWSYTDVTLEKEWKEKGFKWTSEKIKGRGMLRRDNWGFGQLTLTAFEGTQNVEEVGFLMRNGKLHEVSIAIWNKGDSKNADISKSDFEAIVDACSAGLNQLVAPRFEDKGKDMKSAAKAERRMWVGKEMLAQLAFSGGREKVRDPYSGRERTGKNFQGEFIRLRLLPKPDSLVGLRTSSGGKATVRRSELDDLVTRDPSGDVYISGIPMVDQGDKGYCAVATASRVFNYYGVPADQHEMAQVAGNAAGGGGTNPEEMEDALRKLSGKYKTRFQTLLDLDYSSRKYKSFMKKYNRAAKKLDKKVLDTDRFIYFMGGLDPDVLRAVNGTGSTLDKFNRNVHEYIDKGVPVMWALQLGLFPENGEKAKQAGGGHMRLIIGYNDEKKEVIFSDSWGSGHEKKRMAAADASAATMGLYVLQPSS